MTKSHMICYFFLYVQEEENYTDCKKVQERTLTALIVLFAIGININSH